MRLYSPEKGFCIKNKKGDDSWTWNRVDEATDPDLIYKNRKDPEVGRHEPHLELYEKRYADRFKKLSMVQYISMLEFMR